VLVARRLEDLEVLDPDAQSYTELEVELLYGGMQVWLGHAERYAGVPLLTPGASIAGAEACTR